MKRRPVHAIGHGIRAWRPQGSPLLYYALCLFSYIVVAAARSKFWRRYNDYENGSTDASFEADAGVDDGVGDIRQCIEDHHRGAGEDDNQYFQTEFKRIRQPKFQHIPGRSMRVGKRKAECSV